MSRKSWTDGFRFDRDLWDPSNRFETSWLLSPWVLFACRALISIFIFTTRFYLIARHCISGPRGCDAAVDEFSFFTILTFWGLGFYFAFAAIHTLTYALNGQHFERRDAVKNGEEDQGEDIVEARTLRQSRSSLVGG
ncbi:hypothetical protein BN1723_008806 [Verticillium longisporum]|uniref:Uncharacterized protein n=1 Tax=Verticillium longisporum TaxID=100787 RepID=A0A0G4KJW2_VERLO|nr:hypothetical protein BN1723_008806 [Verticillium longisporum]